jgi:hypothetical protein
MVEMFPLFGYASSVGRDRVKTIRWVSPSPMQFSNPIKLSWSVMTLRKSNGDRRPPLYYPDTSSFVPLWKPVDGIAGESALRAEKKGDDLVLLPTQDDPQILLKASQDLSQFKCILIRARFSVADQINLFFGQQINGRGFAGYVPITGRWVDVYVKVDSNPFWKTEAGALLRFDPVTSRYANSRIDLAGVWGSIRSFSANPGEMSVYLSQTGAPNREHPSREHVDERNP